MFKVNDIVQYQSPSINTTKYLVIGVDANFYCLKELTGRDKGNIFKHRKELADLKFKFVAHHTTKQPKEVFKPNSLVELTYSTNPAYIGKVAVFETMLTKEIKVEGIVCDCLINFDGKCRLYCTDWLKRIPKPNRPQKGSFTKEEVYAPLFKIEMSGNKVIAKRIKEFGIDDDNKRIVIKKQEDFEARCHKKDIYDEETGVLIALARAYNDKLLEYYALNHKYFKETYNHSKFQDELNKFHLIPVWIREEQVINDKQCK